MNTLFRSTPKQLISSLPKVEFKGKIVVVHSQREVKAAVDFLKRQTIVGVDTETRPSFRRGLVYQVALLQVSTLEVCFLFRLNMIGLPVELIQLLENPQLTKIGLSLKDDLALLKRRASFTPQGFLDLQDFVKTMGIEDMSLQKLYANVFGEKISKSAQLTNWENTVLTEAQKMYAATDAYTTLRLYLQLAALKESGDYKIIEAEASSPVKTNK
jgi:ribonuclease D